MEYFREITGAAEFQAGTCARGRRYRDAGSVDDRFSSGRARSDLRAEARDAVCGGGATRGGRAMGRRFLQPRGRQRPVQARAVDRRPALGAGEESGLLHQGRSAPGRGGRGNRRQRRFAVAQVRGRRDRRFENSVGRVSVRDEDAEPARADAAYRGHRDRVPRDELRDEAVRRRSRAACVQLRDRQAQDNRSAERTRRRRDGRPAARSAGLQSEPEGLSLRPGQGAAAARAGGGGTETFRRRSGCAPIGPR